MSRRAIDRSYGSRGMTAGERLELAVLIRRRMLELEHAAPLFDPDTLELDGWRPALPRRSAF